MTTFVSSGFIGAMYGTAAFALILMSSVVVTGYAGQLSLAQLGLAGAGAFIGSRVAKSLDSASGQPWRSPWPGPARRDPRWHPGAPNSWRQPGDRHTWHRRDCRRSGHFERQLHRRDRRHASPAAKPFRPLSQRRDTPGQVLHAVSRVRSRGAFAVANLRRSSVGRYLIALRGSEPAAASLGLNVARLKLYAFAIGAVLATIGGMLIVYQAPVVNWASGWDVISGIVLLGGLVIAGLGFTSGAIAAALAATVGVIPYLVGLIGTGAVNWITPFLGIGTILAIVRAPDGAIPLALKNWQATRERKAVRLQLPRDDESGRSDRSVVSRSMLAWWRPVAA